MPVKFPEPSRLDPEFLLMLSEPIEDVYEGIEHDLLVNLAAHFQGGARVPKKLIPGSAKWSAWMLAQIGALTKENMRIIAAYSGDASEATALAVETTVTRAIDAVEPELAAAFVAPEYLPKPSSTTTRVMESYARQAVNRQNLVNTVLLNSSLKAYRETVSRVSADYERALAKAQLTLNQETGAVLLGAKTRQQAISAAVKRMAADGLTGYTDRAGKQWSAQAYAAMDIRTTTANAARAAVQQRNEDYGNHLISVSSHPGARPLCAPYQGNVYSTDGSSGTTTDLHGKKIEYTPLESTSYGQPAGLFGINCGHMSYPFIPGMSAVRAEKYDPEENARLYKESQQQRYLERRVRKAKTEADALDAAGDKEGAKAARRVARERTAELKQWCEDKNRDFYPERVRVVKPGEAVERFKMNLQLFAERGKIAVDGQEVNTQIREQKQREHVEGTKEYRRRLEQALSNGRPLPSVFNADEDIEQLILKHAGKGSPYVGANGVSEYCEADHIVGKSTANNAQVYENTSVFCIRYSKGGCHAFPVVRYKKE